MEISGNEKNEKNETFCCETCGFICRYTSDWNRHLKTRKHIVQCVKEINGNGCQPSSASLTSNKKLSCDNCDRQFKTVSGLWKHKKKCSEDLDKQKMNAMKEKAKLITDKDELIMFLTKECTDYKALLTEQQSMMMKVIENGVGNNSHNINTNNSHNNNKTFNLQVFLNETCKNAMNLTDFVDSIKLQISDLERFAELGYVDNISNIIATNLNTLDITERTVHCTDKKRETVYVKNDNQWTKEDDNKSSLRKAIQHISNKNIKLLPQFREKYPNYSDSSLHLFSFKTPIIDTKNKKICKINFDGLTFSSSLLLLKK